MKTPFSLALGSALCLLLSSCVTDSVNPLSSPDLSQADQRLVGDWRGGTDSDRNICRFSITTAPWMHVVITPEQTDAGNRPSMIDRKPEEYDFFSTVIGKDTFLNVVMVGKNDKNRTVKTYVFLRYKFLSDHILNMWMMSQDLPAAAIRAGKLKGLVKQNGLTLAQPARPDVDVALQDTGANIVKFIQNSNLDELFNNKMNGFYRVKASGKQTP
jgi:hypothetical protein